MGLQVFEDDSPCTSEETCAGYDRRQSAEDCASRAEKVYNEVLATCLLNPCPDGLTIKCVIDLCNLIPKRGDLELADCVSKETAARIAENARCRAEGNR